MKKLGYDENDFTAVTIPVTLIVDPTNEDG